MLSYDGCSLSSTPKLELRGKKNYKVAEYGVKNLYSEYEKFPARAGDMTQCLKVLIINPDDLGSVPWTRVAEEANLLKLPSDLPTLRCWGGCLPTPPPKINEYCKKKKILKKNSQVKQTN